MINSVHVKNYLGEELLMELRFPERTGLFITNITGIGPGKAEIRSTPVVTTDGSVYNSARLPEKEIVLSLLLMANPSAEESRHKTYKYFPLKKMVTLTINTDDRISWITGYTQSNEPVIFEEREYAQITILCPYPYFYKGGSGELNTTLFFGVDPMFSFPFSNESLTKPLIQMGEIVRLQERIVTYDGDSDVGMIITIDFIGPVTDLTIFNVDTRQVMKINSAKLEELTGQGMINGDRIIISTVVGNKSIQLLRNGKYTNILNVLDKNITWFKLFKGNNTFAFDADEGVENLLFKIENRTLYEGV